MGRIASVKMTVLPRLLYYFLTLPIQVPVAGTCWFQSKILHYIWGTKGPRIAWATMYAPKDPGGLRVPQFQKYYLAAQLSQLYQLHSHHYCPDWVLLEAQACSPLAMDLTFGLSQNTAKLSWSQHSPIHWTYGTEVAEDGPYAQHIPQWLPYLATPCSPLVYNLIDLVGG